MTVKEIQETAYKLLKEKQIYNTNSDYSKALNGSDGLRLAREIAEWWRGFQIEQYCPLTSKWLKLNGRYDAQVAAFYQNQNISAFIEEAAMAFLDFVVKNGAPTSVALAATEKALLELKKGMSIYQIIEWQVDPIIVINQVLSPVMELKTRPKAGDFYIVVSSELEKGFEVFEKR